MNILERLESILCITNDKRVMERNTIIEDAIKAINDRDARINELERDEWKKWVDR